MEVVQSIGALLDVEASGSGEMELHDRLRSGRPATATSPDMLQHANDIIHADRYIQFQDGGEIY